VSLGRVLKIREKELDQIMRDIICICVILQL
jgi:hypothetical protein